jgi:hypothetical protein
MALCGDNLGRYNSDTAEIKEAKQVGRESRVNHLRGLSEVVGEKITHRTDNGKVYRGKVMHLVNGKDYPTNFYYLLTRKSRIIPLTSDENYASFNEEFGVSSRNNLVRRPTV